MLNEADTRAQLIDPQLNRAGWTRSQVTREHYYRPDWEFAPGRVVLRGSKAQREKPRLHWPGGKQGTVSLYQRCTLANERSAESLHR